MANLRAWPPRASLALAAPRPAVLVSRHCDTQPSHPSAYPHQQAPPADDRSPRASRLPVRCTSPAVRTVPLDIKKRETSSCGEIHRQNKQLLAREQAFFLGYFDVGFATSISTSFQPRFNLAFDGEQAAGSERVQAARE